MTFNWASAWARVGAYWLFSNGLEAPKEASKIERPLGPHEYIQLERESCTINLCENAVQSLLAMLQVSSFLPIFRFTHHSGLEEAQVCIFSSA